MSNLKNLKNGRTVDILHVLTLVSQFRQAHEALMCAESTVSILKSIYYTLETELRRTPTVEEIQAKLIADLSRRIDETPQLH